MLISVSLCKRFKSVLLLPSSAEIEFKPSLSVEIEFKKSLSIPSSSRARVLVPRSFSESVLELSSLSMFSSKFCEEYPFDSSVYLTFSVLFLSISSSLFESTAPKDFELTCSINFCIRWNEGSFFM